MPLPMETCWLSEQSPKKQSKAWEQHAETDTTPMETCWLSEQSPKKQPKAWEQYPFLSPPPKDAAQYYNIPGLIQ